MSNISYTFNTDEDLNVIVKTVLTTADYTFSSNLSVQSITKALDEILDYESQEYDDKTKEIYTANIILKNFETDKLVELIKYFLQKTTLVNSSILVNLLNLVKSYNSFDDSFFNHPITFYRDIEQFLDVKEALQDELQEFINTISLYYISILRSVHKTSYTYLDQPVILPKLYQRLFLSTDFITLSGIFAKANKLSIEDLLLVDNAYLYLSEEIRKLSITDSLMSMFLPLVNANEQA